MSNHFQETKQLLEDGARQLADRVDEVRQIRQAVDDLITDKDNLTARNALLEKKISALITTSESLVRDKDRLLTELDGANALADDQAKSLAVFEQRCVQRTQLVHQWLGANQAILTTGIVPSARVADLLDGLAAIADGTFAEAPDELHIEKAVTPSADAQTIGALFGALATLLQSSDILKPGASLSFEFVKD